MQGVTFTELRNHAKDYFDAVEGGDTIHDAIGHDLLVGIRLLNRRSFVVKIIDYFRDELMKVLRVYVRWQCY